MKGCFCFAPIKPVYTREGIEMTALAELLPSLARGSVDTFASQGHVQTCRLSHK